MRFLLSYRGDEAVSISNVKSLHIERANNKLDTFYLIRAKWLSDEYGTIVFVADDVRKAEQELKRLVEELNDT